MAELLLTAFLGNVTLKSRASRASFPYRRETRRTLDPRANLRACMCVRDRKYIRLQCERARVAEPMTRNDTRCETCDGNAARFVTRVAVAPSCRMPLLVPEAMRARIRQQARISMRRFVSGGARERERERERVFRWKSPGYGFADAKRNKKRAGISTPPFFILLPPPRPATPRPLLALPFLNPVLRVLTRSCPSPVAVPRVMT